MELLVEQNYPQLSSLAAATRFKKKKLRYKFGKALIPNVEAVFLGGKTYFIQYVRWLYVAIQKVTEKTNTMLTEKQRQC